MIYHGDKQIQRIFHGDKEVKFVYQGDKIVFCKWLDYVHYDKKIYQEPDGSLWLRIFHHAGTSSQSVQKFSTALTSTNWNTGVYEHENRWFDMIQICNALSKWEFIISERAKLQSATSSIRNYVFRLTQSKNPFKSTYASPPTGKFKTGSTNLNPYTTSLSSSTYGSAFVPHDKNCKLRQRDSSATNWWGAIGAVVWFNNNMIPVFKQNDNVVLIGKDCFYDIYIRIDNV